MHVCVVIDAYDVIDMGDAIDACMYAMRLMQIDTCDAIDACMYAMQSIHMM